MKRKLLLISVIVLFSSQFLPGQNPYIHHYTTFDGLPCNSINNVFQDSQKFIWFATDAGAVRYDGAKFTTFTKKEGLNTSKINKIKEDSFGRIWIFNWDGSLNFYIKNKIFNSTSAAFLDSLKPNDAFHDFFEDDDKTIYFFNAMYEIFVLDSINHVKKIEKLSEYLIENLRTKEGIKATGPYPKSYTSSFPEFILANLYKIRKTTYGDYLFWSRRGFFQVNELFKNPVMLNYSFRSYLRASCMRDSIYYIMGFGYYVVKFKDERLQELVQMPNYIMYTMSRQNALFRDRDGFYWVGTFDDGLYCLQEDKVILNQQPGPIKKSSKIIQHLDIRQVNGIIQDHEGNIWISSAAEGVYKISPYLNTHRHYESEQFQNKGIKEMAAGLKNGMWLSNGRTIYLLMADSIYTLGFQEKNTSFNIIYHLKTNKLILGEKYSYFYVVNDPIPDPVTKKVNFSSADTSIFYMSGISVNEKEDKINCYNYFDFNLIDPDTLFIAYNSGFWQKNYNVGSRIYYTYYNTEDELIINAKKNYILLNDTCLPATDLSCFDNKIITQHINLNPETELFNIENETFHLFHDHKFYNLSSAFATPADLKISGISYNDPILYMANFSNIYKCDNPLDVINNQPVNLQLIDINFKNIHKILVLNDSLYIASDDGLTVIPEEEIKNIATHNPTPYIQTILVNDKETDFSQKNLVLKGRNSLKFIFGSINYSSTPVIYSYKLDGTDTDWSSGTGNIVAYQNLPFGEYVFRLRISKPNAAWSEPLNIRIMIKPRFWQHPAFLIFVIVLIMASSTLVIIRIAQNKIRRRETDHQLILLEQKALQSMMNPHFIFNTLGSIQNYLLQNKSSEAGLYLSQFARLIRLNISSINSTLINLEEEVNRLRIYLDLEQFRTDHKFKYLIEFDQDVDEEDVYIPSMIIQPFVENSVWHGISALEGKGMIWISFSIHSSKALKIIVEDNGIGIQQSEKNIAKKESHLHLSMEMIRKRLEIIGKKMKVETGMEISETSPGSLNPGTRVTLTVPFSRNENGT